MVGQVAGEDLGHVPQYPSVSSELSTFSRRGVVKFSRHNVANMKGLIMQSSKRVLVVGLGIAGMATAVRLKDAGWEPVIIERAPERRSGGYFIGLFAEGREAAERLGVLGNITRENPAGSKTWEVDSDGDRTLSIGFLDQPGHPRGVLRGDIEAALWERVRDEIEVRYSVTPEAIRSMSDRAYVVLRNMQDGTLTEESYDLVIGADGLRSTVRQLVFGPNEQFMKPFNAIICAFALDSQVPQFAERDGLVLAEPGRSLWVFPFGDRTPTALLTYRTTDEDAEFRRPPIETLRARYAGVDGDGAVAHVLDELESAPDFLFDSVHQVKMPSWHQGRVVLLGDSAWCLTLYSGMGATAGLMGADALGAALEANPASIESALTEWEAGLRPFIKKHQFGAHIKGQVFVPSNRFLARVRTAVMRRQGQKVRVARAERTPAPVS
ncbi:FAD-dependent monooxygenase [Curtobacterium sp. AB7]|uniref:FAD-dependent monooxygenase n=1 Tax=Curtobacterium sp. AB7 TaxID=3349327 RepID=UPI0038505DD1